MNLHPNTIFLVKTCFVMLFPTPNFGFTTITHFITHFYYIDERWKTQGEGMYQFSTPQK